MNTVANPAQRQDCPDWCAYDHAAGDDPRDGLVMHLGNEHTDGTVRRLLGAGPGIGSELDIRVVRCDCPSEDTVGTPSLHVRADLEVTTWEQAAELARTILDAFGYLQGSEK